MGRSVTEVINRLEDAYIGVDFHAILLDDQRSQYEFTVNATTDVLTTAESNDYIDDMPVTVSVSGGGTLPAPLLAGTTYYTRDCTSTTLKLSLTNGGAAIDITNAGTGVFLITDVALSIYTATVEEMTRKEISSYGALTNRPLVSFSNPVTTSPNPNPTTASLTQSFGLDNSAGLADLPVINAVCLIRDGSATPLNTTGDIAIFSNLLSSVVITAGQILSLEVPITVAITP